MVVIYVERISLFAARRIVRSMIRGGVCLSVHVKTGERIDLTLTQTLHLL